MKVTCHTDKSGKCNLAFGSSFEWEAFPNRELAIWLHGKSVSRIKAKTVFKRLATATSPRVKLLLLYSFILGQFGKQVPPDLFEERGKEAKREADRSSGSPLPAKTLEDGERSSALSSDLVISKAGSFSHVETPGFDRLKSGLLVPSRSQVCLKAEPPTPKGKPDSSKASAKKEGRKAHGS